MTKKIIMLSTLLALALLLTIHTVTGDDAKPPPKGNATIRLPLPMKNTGHTAAVGRSANFEIWWQVLSSGATEGASASFDLRGTLGQPVVGYGESESFQLSHGFWQEFGGGCCSGIRGNADGDGSDAINVADLTYLVDYLFFGGPAPPCPEEGDVNGDGAINVADLTYLVEYLFFGGPTPAACP